LIVSHCERQRAKFPLKLNRPKFDRSNNFDLKEFQEKCSTHRDRTLDAPLISMVGPVFFIPGLTLKYAPCQTFLPF